MSIGNYRARRNRRNPQEGSIGAPLRGVYLVVASINAAAKTATISSVVYSTETFSVVPFAAWCPLAVVDVSAFVLFSFGAEHVVESAVVSADGSSIEVSWSEDIAGPEIIAVPGHPALVSMEGWQCGGSYVF